MSNPKINSLNDPVQLNPSSEHTSVTSIFDFAPQVSPDAEGTEEKELPTEEEKKEKLQLIELSSDPLLTIAFTTGGIEVDAHSSTSSGGPKYMWCDGEGCDLCHHHMSKMKVSLIPLFVPTHDAVQVLGVNQDMNSTAMLPQLRAVFASPSNRLPLKLHISENGSRFSVSSEQPGGEVDIKEHPIISAFMDEFAATREILSSALRHFTYLETVGYSTLMLFKRSEDKPKKPVRTYGSFLPKKVSFLE